MRLGDYIIKIFANDVMETLKTVCYLIILIITVIDFIIVSVI